MSEFGASNRYPQRDIEPMRGVSGHARVMAAAADLAFPPVEAERPEWHDEALCKGEQHLFFKGKGDHGDNQEMYPDARRMCAQCPVKAECLSHALNQPENFGFWGGMSPKERRAERQRLGIAKNRNAVYLRVCHICGEEFQARSVNGSLCSRACRRKAQTEANRRLKGAA